MRSTFNMNNAVMVNATEAAVFRGTSARWVAPLVRGEMDVKQWLTWINQESAQRKDGSFYPAAYAAVNAAPYAVSEVSRRLYAANKAGLISYVDAVHQANAFKATVDSAAMGLAATLRIGHAETPAATVRVNSISDGGSERRDFKAELREAYEDLRQQHYRGEINEEQFKLALLELKEFVDNHDWEQEAQDNGIQNTSGDAKPDEGSIEVALHEMSQLWEYEVRDIRGMESAMVEAIVAWKKADLPVGSPHWQSLLDRLADSWAASLEYAGDAEERERMEAKIAYRSAIAEHGLLAMPWKARWAVNHITRRVWRDMQMLKRRIEGHETKIDELGSRAVQEERLGLTPRVTRKLSEAPSTETNEGEDREHYLYWDTVTERDIAPDWHGMSQGEYDIAVQERVKERADKVLAAMQELYAELRRVDLALTPVWEAMYNPEDEVVMPNQPPVYWDQHGFYLTEEDALAALDREREQRQMRTLEGAGDYIEQLLAAQGINL